MQKTLGIILITLYISTLALTGGMFYVKARFPIKYASQIEYFANKYNIPLSTGYSLINVESSFNPSAKSNAGAIGLTQILPSTANYICGKNGINFSNLNLENPDDNIKVGFMYLQYLLNKFDDKYTALSAYNAGETVVNSWLKNPEYSTDKITLKNIPYIETKNYIKKIKINEKIYKYYYKLM